MAKEVNFVYNEATTPEPIRIEQVFAEKPGGGMVANPSFDAPATTAVALNDNGQYDLIKCYRLYAAAEEADTTIKVYKNSGVAVGDVIATGKKGVACTAVDTSNEDYDLVTVSLGTALDAGTALYQAKEASDSAAVPAATPVYVTGAAVYADKGDQAVRLINGANLRKETANISPEVAALIGTIKLV